MKKYLVILPVFLLLVASSCSEAESTPESSVENEESKKPLLEREPDLKEYLDVLDVAVDEYLTLGENLLDHYESFEEGDMDTFEKIEAMAEISQSLLAIEELTTELGEMEETRSKLEKELDADDLLEFGLLFNDKMERINELSERISTTDFSGLTSLF